MSRRTPSTDLFLRVHQLQLSTLSHCHRQGLPVSFHVSYLYVRLSKARYLKSMGRSVSMGRPFNFYIYNICTYTQIKIYTYFSTTSSMLLCRYNGNKFQRCTTEVFDRAAAKTEENEEKPRGCERERLPRRRQGEPRVPVQSRTVSKEFNNYSILTYICVSQGCLHSKETANNDNNQARVAGTVVCN